MTGVAVVAEHVRKTFDGGRIVALADVSLELGPGEFVALTGPSGCGKSTLLNILGALDRADAGAVRVGDERLDALADAAAYRSSTVGFVFQFHYLIPTLSALENVQVPLVGHARRREREHRARELLREVGLDERERSRPTTLSGGERQRVAIARALANEPQLLLADEPTGALDADTGAQILDLLRRVREERGTTILMVTNDDATAEVADRLLRLRDGRIVTRDAAPRPARA